MTEEEQKRLEWSKRLDPPELAEESQMMPGVFWIDAIRFFVHRLTEAAYRWWQTYDLGRPAGIAPLTWHEFSVLFLEKFVPQTRRVELRREFEQLRQEDMKVTQYKMRFVYLECHVILLVPIEREKISRFIDGLNYGLCYSLAREVKTDARFDQVAELARRLEQVHRLEREEREAKRSRGLGGFSSSSSAGQSHYNRGRPSWTA
ncbi:uncharacterized protein [Nicotiana tomentosiformis]|uniref:uncharacterized protein n=1 Tax=Nicotiana tomentosiformis TaxID=4098 RepID=UPI00388C7911